MSWYLLEADDSIRTSLEKSESKPEWYEMIGSLGDLVDGDSSGSLEEEWPIWFEATENLDGPLSYLFKGEIHTGHQGGDAEIAFIGAPVVKELAEQLQRPDQWFLELLQTRTSFGRKCPDRCEPECMYVLPILRTYFAGAASRDKAVLVIMPG